MGLIVGFSDVRDALTFIFVIVVVILIFVDIYSILLPVTIIIYTGISCSERLEHYNGWSIPEAGQVNSSCIDSYEI